VHDDLGRREIGDREMIQWAHGDSPLLRQRRKQVPCPARAHIVIDETPLDACSGRHGERSGLRDRTGAFR
jgi:hypothetical protein